jgi:CSL zinc finger
MSVYYDEIEIEDFEYDDELDVYFYPCPCGDRFEITKVLKLIFPPIGASTMPEPLTKANRMPLE